MKILTSLTVMVLLRKALSKKRKTLPPPTDTVEQEFVDHVRELETYTSRAVTCTAYWRQRHGLLVCKWEK